MAQDLRSLILGSRAFVVNIEEFLTLSTVVGAVIAHATGSEFINQKHFVAMLTEKLAKPFALGWLLEFHLVLLFPITKGNDNICGCAILFFEPVNHRILRSRHINVGIPSHLAIGLVFIKTVELRIGIVLGCQI